MTEISADPVPTDPATSEENWEDAPRRPSASAAPVLAVVGFEGPLDWLLEMARAQRIDLATLSIVDLVDAFVAALDAALAEHAVPADLSRWGEWLVMAATLALLRSRLLLPRNAPEARAAQDEAEAMRRQLLERVAIRHAAEWLDCQPQLGRNVFARGGVADAARSGRTTDITDLFRACLVALRVPDQSTPIGCASASSGGCRTPWRTSHGDWQPDRRAERSRASCRGWTARGRTASFGVGRRWRAPSWERSNSHGAGRSRLTRKRWGKTFSSLAAEVGKKVCALSSVSRVTAAVPWSTRRAGPAFARNG